MKILTEKQYNEKLAEVAEKTSRDIHDREELCRLTNKIEELEYKCYGLGSEIASINDALRALGYGEKTDGTDR